MESPFYSNHNGNHYNKTFTLFLEPILVPFEQTYINAITVSCMPPGPLAAMVKMMSLPKLSPFVSNNDSVLVPNFGCTFVLMRYPVGFSNKKISDYMFSHDIPALFSYLENNGYTINTSTTKMMNESRVLIRGISTSDRRMICFVSY